MSDVLLWTPTYGRAKAGRPARTFIQQLCEDTECSPEDLPEAMNDRKKWRERVRDIRASGTTWWWWWWWWFNYLFFCYHKIWLSGRDYVTCFISRSQWILCVPFSKIDSTLSIYHLFARLRLNFLHSFQLIIFSTQSCVVLYSFTANLVHSVIIWLIISSLSPHNLHLLFCCVLSIFALLFTPLEFFTSVLADGFSMEFEWQQVSSSLQDSS